MLKLLSKLEISGIRLRVTNNTYNVLYGFNRWVSLNNRVIKQMENLSIEPASDGFSSFERCVSRVLIG